MATSPTFVAATAMREKKPCLQQPFSTTRSFIQNNFGSRSKSDGRTESSKPELKNMIQCRAFKLTFLKSFTQENLNKKMNERTRVVDFFLHCPLGRRMKSMIIARSQVNNYLI